MNAVVNTSSSSLCCALQEASAAEHSELPDAEVPDQEMVQEGAVNEASADKDPEVVIV